MWPKFVTFIEDNIAQSEVGVLCAYNGQACDLQCIFRLTKTTEYNLKLPERVDHFLDPLYVISHYKTCGLNTTKSKQENTRLATVYQFVTGVPLANAHDALADSKAQLEIVMSTESKPFLDKTKSSKLLEDVWSHKVKTAANIALEPLHGMLCHRGRLIRKKSIGYRHKMYSTRVRPGIHPRDPHQLLHWPAVVAQVFGPCFF